MNRSHKIVAFLLVVGFGIYGCAKNPTGNARSDGGQQYAKHYREFHDWLRAKTPEEKRPFVYFR